MTPATLPTSSALASPASPLPLQDAIRAIIGGSFALLPDFRLSQGNVARRIGVTPPVISSWLGGKYTGRVDVLERKLADLVDSLIAESKRERDSQILFPTDITERVGRYLTAIKEQGYMGTLPGMPGLGKSSGLAMYLREHPLDIGIEINCSECPGTAAGLIEAFWACPSFNRQGFKGSGLKRSTFISHHFEGQKRLLIVDSAQYLKPSGMKWLVGFHEYTKCPVALVGNRELMDVIASSERAPTHVGFHKPVEFDHSTAAGRRTWESFVVSYARLFAETHWPDAQDVVIPLAERIIRSAKNVRNLRNVSQLARPMLRKARSVEDAFEAAMALQIHNYSLE